MTQWFVVEVEDELYDKLYKLKNMMVNRMSYEELIVNLVDDAVDVWQEKVDEINSVEIEGRQNERDNRGGDHE